MQLPALLSAGMDWPGAARLLNQASLLPFVAFLLTLRRIPDMPARARRGFEAYLAFVAVAIPAGMFARAQLGTSLSNVDWLHGAIVRACVSWRGACMYVRACTCACMPSCSKRW